MTDNDRPQDAGSIMMRMSKILIVALTLAVAVAAGGVSARASRAAPSVLDPALISTLAAADPVDRVIVFVHGATIENAVHAVDDAGLQLLDRWSRIGVAVAAGPPAAIRRAAADPAVSFIESNSPVELFLDTAHIATRAEEALDEATGLLDEADIPYDGSGVTIAVPDTGIDGTHPMFMQDGLSKVVRNLRLACAVDLDPCGTSTDVDFNDPDGHGTHLAGIAAGFGRVTADGRSVRGVAPGAKLVGLGSEDGTLLYGVLSGLNWILEHHLDPCGDGSCPPIKVVSNSWGTVDSSAAIKLSDALVGEGIVVVFAIGNAGGDGSEDLVLSLAKNATPGVIGAANYDDAGRGSRDYALASDSSRGLRADPRTYPDLAAPGTGITSACTAIHSRCEHTLEVDPYYRSASGTSMAAPYVAGVVALLLHADPTLTPAEIESLLEDTAYQFGEPDYVSDPRNPNHTTSFDRGHGLIDVTAALAAVLDRQVHAGPACGQHVIDDAEGDATDVVVETGLPSAASEPGLDITRAWVSTDPSTGALAFSVQLADLGVLPPPGAAGEYLRFHFSYRNVPYEVHMERLGGDAGIRTTYHLQTAGTALERVIVAEGLVGSFDSIGDVVRAVVPADALHAWDPAVPVIGDGDILTAFQVVANRPLGVRPAGPAFVTADTVRGGCPYIVGS